MCARYISIVLFACAAVFALQVVATEPGVFSGATARGAPPTAGSGNQAVKYTSLKIIKPENDATVRLNEGPVSITVELKPALQTDFRHRLQYLVDGEVNTESEQATVELSNVYRGTHTIAVRVINEQNTTLISAKPVTVHVRQPSVLFRQRQK